MNAAGDLAAAVDKWRKASEEVVKAVIVARACDVPWWWICQVTEKSRSTLVDIVRKREARLARMSEANVGLGSGAEKRVQEKSRECD
jgi:hypothetical protein